MPKSLATHDAELVKHLGNTFVEYVGEHGEQKAVEAMFDTDNIFFAPKLVGQLFENSNLVT